eukprot:jgi/Ulvmu1/6912/UM031_0119.1
MPCNRVWRNAGSARSLIQQQRGRAGSGTAHVNHTTRMAVAPDCMRPTKAAFTSGTSSPSHSRQLTARFVQAPDRDTTSVTMGDVTTEDGSFVNARGQKLVTRVYLPPTGTEVQGIFMRHHGLGDYKDRTEPGHKIFAKAGFAVWTFDAHGHGDSEPTEAAERHTLARFEHLVVDAEQFLLEVVQPWREAREEPLPLYVNGASLGGLVMMHVVGRGVVPKPDGVVLSCAAAGIVRNLVMRVQEPISGLLNIFMPKWQIVPALEPERLCSDPVLIEDVKKDDKLAHGNVRVCTACAILDGINRLPAVVPNITAPVLMLHGANDVTCSPDTAKKCLDSMQSIDKTWVLLPDAKHDLELDYWKDEWHDHVRTWLLRHADDWAPPSGPSQGIAADTAAADEVAAAPAP